MLRIFRTGYREGLAAIIERAEMDMIDQGHVEEVLGEGRIEEILRRGNFAEFPQIRSGSRSLTCSRLVDEDNLLKQLPEELLSGTDAQKEVLAEETEGRKVGFFLTKYLRRNRIQYLQTEIYTHFYRG